MIETLMEVAEDLLKFWISHNVFKDFSIFQLFMRVCNLLSNLPEDIDSQDVQLASIMTWMEREYKIPMLDVNIKNWLKTNEHSKFILDVYNKISDLRSI